MRTVVESVSPGHCLYRSDERETPTGVCGHSNDSSRVRTSVVRDGRSHLSTRQLDSHRIAWLGNELAQLSPEIMRLSKVL